MGDASIPDGAGDAPTTEPGQHPAESSARPALAAARAKPVRASRPVPRPPATPTPAPEPASTPRWMVPPLAPITRRGALLRAGLILAVILAIFAIAAGGLLLSRQANGASTTRELAYTLGEGGSLRIATDRGNITVAGRPQEALEVTATLTNDDAISFGGTQDGSSIRVEADIDEPLITRLAGLGEPEASMVAIAPAPATLDARTAHGALGISAMNGGGQLEGNGGIIELTDAAGTWQIDGRNADITITRLGGSATVTADGGSITVDSVTHSLDIAARGTSVSVHNTAGELTITNTTDIAVVAHTGAFALATTEGDVSFASGIAAGSQNTITSELGNITAELTSTPNVTLVIHAPRGSIRLNGQPVGSVHEEVLGDGSARLEITADEGDIALTVPIGLELSVPTATPTPAATPAASASPTAPTSPTAVPTPTP